MTSAPIPPLDPPTRLLMGPGPINPYPRVLRALSTPLIGQFDPFMTDTMSETQELYRTVWDTANDATVLIDGTARAGIEAALVSLISPGDRVLVPVFGRFGHLLVEIAQRAGAEVHTLEAEWGTTVPTSRLAEALRSVRPKLVATVQGDTSTTINQPLEEFGRLCERFGALLYADATASLGGNEFHADAWGLDAATCGLQKCLGGPSGSAPLTLSPRAVETIRSRSRIEAGIREADDPAAGGDVIRSNYFDLGMILDYWGPRRLNHHTEATSMLYAARECAALFVEEGPDAVVERHRLAGGALCAGLQSLGLELFGEAAHRMNNVVGVVIPETVDGDAVRAGLLEDFGIEIGTSFGPLAGRVWRIGTMGYNARKDTVLTTLAALSATLGAHGMPNSADEAIAAAQEVFAG
ncbi:alanine--glyoxylate aminotransferase family protein [Brevibacterium sp. 50QC2O2]|uniref:pyridoxal-phosphate-dependent aminotransferase family protein n=1 Tax=Brevibacterium sp. 50QC2O2 TaxID=2968459 RepID=UPI00211C33DF|nr:alanine--glyoxylate aminotransferase family protein [Brevibacterium sp. 50QC2O2]MCQ9388127.1 alanine--glyoxylate aminotransferase family protein [Brevibacterium sp. 50QC2O2]